jgi:hypothetical protein
LTVAVLPLDGILEQVGHPPPGGDARDIGDAAVARESCVGSRFIESSALCSSRDDGFDVATLDDRQDAQRTRTGRART